MLSLNNIQILPAESAWTHMLDWVIFIMKSLILFPRRQELFYIMTKMCWKIWFNVNTREGWEPGTFHWFCSLSLPIILICPPMVIWPLREPGGTCPEPAVTLVTAKLPCIFSKGLILPLGKEILQLSACFPSCCFPCHTTFHFLTVSLPSKFNATNFSFLSFSPT